MQNLFKNTKHICCVRCLNLSTCWNGCCQAINTCYNSKVDIYTMGLVIRCMCRGFKPESQTDGGATNK